MVFHRLNTNTRMPSISTVVSGSGGGDVESLRGSAGERAVAVSDDVKARDAAIDKLATLVDERALMSRGRDPPLLMDGDYARARARANAAFMSLCVQRTRAS
jgi:hypothetical protein